MGGDDKVEASDDAGPSEVATSADPPTSADAPAEESVTAAEAATDESPAEDVPGNGAAALADDGAAALADDDGDDDADDDADDNDHPAPSVEDLELENKALTVRVAEYKDRVLRGAAELENVRRRATKEADDAKKFGIERLLTDLLPILDNFDRALSHGKGEDADLKQVVEGVEMVLGQFRSGLERHGVTPFDSIGKRFDPNLHEAIQRKETDEAEPGTVLEEFQRGYMIHGRLARPAMVIVASKPAVVVEVAPEPEPESESEPGPEMEIEIEPDAAGEPGPSEPGASDAGSSDAGSSDAGSSDAGSSDAGSSDAGSSDAGSSDAGPSDDQQATSSPAESDTGIDVSGLEGKVTVVGATLADATGAILDSVGVGHGAVITEVSELSPAARAGLQSGDLVTEVGSRQVMDARAFKRAVQQYLPRKQPFTIAYQRGGDTHETKLGGR
jgi:molecular chaperone GrpE